MSSYDPRDHCESEAELAREVLDREELAEYFQSRAERARVAAARRRRKETMEQAARAERRRLEERDGQW